MPELPEVETVRRSLAPHLEGRRIERVRVLAPHLVAGDAEAFRAGVGGARVRRLDRRGKYLIFRLDRGQMAFHLRMTGRLLYVAPSGGAAPRVAEGAPGIHAGNERALAVGWRAPDWLKALAGEGAEAPPHTHLVLDLDDGGRLLFNDVRKFGRAWFWRRGQRPPYAGLGPEPMGGAFTAARLAAALAGRAAPVKALLLDQRLVAGVGNIYADEALWLARIHSSRPGGSLRPYEVRRLHRALRRVLREAVHHRGTTFRDFRDGLGAEGANAPHLRVYGRAGEPCRRCGRPIEKTVVAQRGTHACTVCQPAHPPGGRD